MTTRGTYNNKNLRSHQSTMPASPTFITRSASNNNNNNNINKNRTGRAHHQRRANRQRIIEELAVLDPVIYRKIKDLQHQREQLILAHKQKRHRRASDKLHAQYKQKQAARQTISKWLRHHINRRRTTHRTKQHIKLRNHCQGTSLYANNIKATRPPIKQRVRPSRLNF